MIVGGNDDINVVEVGLLELFEGGPDEGLGGMEQGPEQQGIRPEDTQSEDKIIILRRDSPNGNKNVELEGTIHKTIVKFESE